MQKQLLLMALLLVTALTAAGFIATAPLAAETRAQANTATILVLGDSLSASYGIDTKRGWVSLLQKRLQKQKYSYHVINASISGDTSLGGRNRITQALARHKPRVIIVELGGNDGLQGLSIEQMRGNLSAIITSSHQKGSKVVLVGVRLPPNYGPAYIEKFHAVYRDLAQTHRTAFVPYMLDGVGGYAELMQADGIHPRSEAQKKILNNIWPHLRPLL